MSYEIILTGENDAIQFLHITSSVFKMDKVWQIQFHDGKEAMLHKCSDEWVQYSGDWLDSPTLIAIGNCIDGTGKKEKLRDSYFYDMLIN